MKNSNKILCIFSVVGLSGLSLLLTACDKQSVQETSTPATQTNAGAATPPAATVALPATNTPVAETPAPAAALVTNQVAAVSTTDAPDSIIDQARTQVTAHNYSEATALLQKVSSLKLGAEQQKLVDDLKQQIEQAVAKQAAGAGAKSLGGLLGK